MLQEERRVTLNYTEEEWNMLRHVAKERGSLNFRHHFTLNIYDIIKEINNLELTAPKRIKNSYFIPDEISVDVLRASTVLQITPTKFVSRYIVDPMLRDYLNWEGLNSGLRPLKF